MTNVLDAYPFDAGPGANSGQTRWQKMAKVWAGNGVVPQTVSRLGGELTSVYNSSANTITVSPGAVNINGTYGELAAQATVNATGDGLLVARLDNTGDQVLVAFNLGASSPSITSTTVEIALARLSSGVLTDQRAFCGPRGSMPAPPTTTGVNTYTDPAGDLWVSKSGSAWRRARDVIAFRGYLTVNQAIVTGGNLVNLNTIGHDIFGQFTAPNYIIPVSGRYRIVGNVGLNAYPVCQLQATIQTATAILAQGSVSFCGSGSVTWPGSSVVDFHLLNAGDSISLHVWLGQVASATLLGQTDRCFLCVDYAGPNA